MPGFVELAAVELAVTVSVGAVLAIISGLLSPLNHSELRHRPQECRRRGSVTALEAGPDQHRASKGRQ